MKENRQWLAYKGLSTAGKADELKLRVKEWVDNTGNLAALPAIHQTRVPTVLDVTVASYVDSHISVVVESIQVHAQATIDEKVVEESTV